MPAVPALLIGYATLPSAAANPVATGVYTLASGAGGKCVDVTSSTTSGTQLQQYSCGDATKNNQLWTYNKARAYVTNSYRTGRLTGCRAR